MECVADILSMLKRDWYDSSPGGDYSLCGQLEVPPSKEEEILSQHQSQQLTSLSVYIVQSLPGISWEVIAGALFCCCEERALQAAKRYIKRVEGKLYSVMKMT